jgi:hypothetical protein
MVTPGFFARREDFFWGLQGFPIAPKFRRYRRRFLVAALPRYDGIRNASPQGDFTPGLAATRFVSAVFAGNA